MVEKEDIENKQQSDSIVDLARGVFGKDTLSRIFVGTCLFLFANSLFGNPVGGIIKDWFGLKQAENEQAYQLQLKTFDLMNVTLLPKIDTLQKDVTNLREEVASIRTDASNIKNDVTQLSAKVNGLEKKVANLETENSVVHALWRRNNAE